MVVIFELNGQKFTPTFMFVKEQSGKAEEAIHYYTSIFSNSNIVGIQKYTADDPDEEGYVKHAQFTLNGQTFMATDSSADHRFSFNEGVSIAVECNKQEEIDYYWESLSKEGEESMCGWLVDKYGVSWQIFPASLGKIMTDPKRAPRAMAEIMKIKKLDIESIENA